MSNFFKLGAVAAAGVAVVLVAALSLGSRPGGVGVQPTPSPTASAVPTPTASPSAAAESTRYESDYLPWAIDLPSGWVATTAEGDETGSYEQFSKYRPTLVNSGVGSTQVPAGQTPEQYVQAVIDQEHSLMASDCDLPPIEPTETTMGGEPALELVYECNSRGVGLIATSHNNRRYVFLFEAADIGLVEDAVAELLPAFEFTD